MLKFEKKMREGLRIVHRSQDRGVKGLCALKSLIMYCFNGIFSLEYKGDSSLIGIYNVPTGHRKLGPTSNGSTFSQKKEERV